ncbi:MAG: Ig-like domain-containing protein, partial [Anaerolineales bacterium]|nr:Ig-like domain-containing protein [Anaerolineales bacterium]
MKKTTLWILIGAFLALISVVAVAGAAYALWQIGPGRPAGPEVLIRAPGLGDQVAVGRNTLVQAIATDVDGVTRVELWADGQLVDLDETSLPAGSTPMPFLSDWQPDSAGAHTLVVRAYDSRRNSGQASVIVTAGEEPAPAAYVVGEAGSGEVPPDVLEALAEEHPDLAEAVESGDVALSPAPADTEEGEGTPPEGETLEPLEGEGPPDPFPGEEMPGLLQRLLGLSTGTFQMPASWLEVEALSLEVDKEYDGVYCYAALGDQGAERLPAEGYIPTGGGRSWDIAAIMGGENRRAVLYPAAGAPLDVVVSCLGINESSSGAGVSFDLGTL